MSEGSDNRGFTTGENLSLSLPDTKTKEELTETELRTETRRVWKSVLVTFIAFSLINSSVITLVGSITSMFPDGNLGISSLAVSGAAQVIAAATLNPVVTKLWGARRMLHLSFLIACLSMVTFFYPTWVTVMIGALLAGIAVALVVSTGYIYLTSAGYYLSQLKKNDMEALLTRLTGLMNASWGCAFVWGNVPLYYIFGVDELIGVSANKFQELCGAGFCNQNLNITTLKPPSPERYYILIGMLQVLSCAGFAVFFLAEDFSSRLGLVNCTKREACQVFRTSWTVLKNPKGFLLVPITVFIGMEESFMIGDITEALVSCSLGIFMVGLVMMAFGISAVITCMLQWLLVRKIGCLAVTAIGIAMFISLFATILLWTPNPHQISVYFIIACIWAIADGVLSSVVFAVYAVLFEDHLDEAFTVAVFWWTFGNLFWFAWSQFVCMTVKLYFTIAFAAISFVLYSYLDRRTLSNRK